MIRIDNEGWGHWSGQYKDHLILAMRSPAPGGQWGNVQILGPDNITHRVPYVFRTIKSLREHTHAIIREKVQYANSTVNTEHAHRHDSSGEGRAYPEDAFRFW